MNYAQGEDGANKFRRLLRNHFSHVASHSGAREGLFAYELWGGLTSDEMIRRVKTLAAKGLAYEDLWIDANWRLSFPDGALQLLFFTAQSNTPNQPDRMMFCPGYSSVLPVPGFLLYEIAVF